MTIQASIVYPLLLISSTDIIANVEAYQANLDCEHAETVELPRVLPSTQSAVISAVGSIVEEVKGPRYTEAERVLRPLLKRSRLERALCSDLVYGATVGALVGASSVVLLFLLTLAY